MKKKIERTGFKYLAFSGSMINALKQGRKFQTRRIATPQPKIREGLVYGCASAGSVDFMRREPWHYFRNKTKPGDLIIVKEKVYLTPGKRFHSYVADREEKPEGMKTRVARFMPKIYSRFMLKAIGVYAERLQDISDCDAELEGFSCRMAFGAYWDLFNGKKNLPISWADNPWVIVINFTVQALEKGAPILKI